MICFRDMTFCSAAPECGQHLCGRRLTPLDREAAIKWWQGFDSNQPEPPIAFSDMSVSCHSFVGQFNIQMDEHGNPHCEGNPAIVWEDGSEFWMIHGRYHREDGPAEYRATEDHAIYYHKGASYYLNGVQQDFDIWCEKTNKTTNEKAKLVLQYG